MNSNTNIRMVNIRFNKSLWMQARLEALKHGLTMQEWLRRAVIQKLLSDGVTPVVLSERGER